MNNSEHFIALANFLNQKVYSLCQKKEIDYRAIRDWFLKTPAFAQRFIRVENEYDALVMLEPEKWDAVAVESLDRIKKEFIALLIEFYKAN